MKRTMAERAARAAERAREYRRQAAATDDPAERGSLLWVAQQREDEARSLSRGVDPLAKRAGERADRRRRRAGLFLKVG